MAKVHVINHSDYEEIALLEHSVRDVILIADTLRALRAHHQGSTIIGMTPAEYKATLKKLLAELGEP